MICCGGVFLPGSRKKLLVWEGKTTLMTKALYVGIVWKMGENVIERENTEKCTYRSKKKKTRKIKF